MTLPSASDACRAAEQPAIVISMIRQRGRRFNSDTPPRLIPDDNHASVHRYLPSLSSWKTPILTTGQQLLATSDFGSITGFAFSSHRSTDSNSFIYFF